MGVGSWEDLKMEGGVGRRNGRKSEEGGQGKDSRGTGRWERIGMVGEGGRRKRYGWEKEW